MREPLALPKRVPRMLPSIETALDNVTKPKGTNPKSTNPKAD